MDAVEFTKPLNDILIDYEDLYLRQNGRELRVNLNRLDRIRGEFGHRQVLTAMDLERFLHTLQSRKPSTRNRYRSLVRHLIRWSLDHGLAQGGLPPSILKKETEHNQRDIRITKAQEMDLLNALPAHLHPLFIAALDTGIRRGALLKLTFADIHDGAILVPGNIQKQKTSQRIPLTQRLARIVSDAAHQSKSKRDRVFDGTDFRQAWDRARKQTQLDGLHWHDLRGEFASRLDEAGVEVSVTSRLLGHASLGTTQRYLRPRTERFQEAIDKLGV